jgi:hypothetical protein
MDEMKHTPTLPGWLRTPWEKRGWGLYVSGTQKRIVEVPLAWKSSLEAEAVVEYVHRAVNCFDDLVAALELVRRGLNSGHIEDQTIIYRSLPGETEAKMEPLSDIIERALAKAKEGR